MNQSLNSQTFYHSYLTPSLVTCAYCQRPVAIADTISFKVMDVLDGDTTNLVSSNIRDTGKTGYECHTCLKLDALSYPAIMFDNQEFRRGYDIGVEEARRGCFVDTLLDVELVKTLKGMFKHYQEG